MKIHFEDSTHTYSNKKTNEIYTSVTTLIHKYVPPFDSDYWSLYKAIKDVLDARGEFSKFKRDAGGWRNVVSFYRRMKYHYLSAEIKSRQNHYLEQWEFEKEYACATGTLVHKELEDGVNNARVIEDGKKIYEVGQKNLLEAQDFKSNGIYTELLVYNDYYKIAGQVDRVKKNRNTVHISDYKTCKKITKEAFDNEKLKYPLESLPNANFYIYTMQMSLYGWILEQYGYNVGSLTLIHFYDKDNTRYKEFNVKYEKQLVEKMLKDYKYNNGF